MSYFKPLFLFLITVVACSEEHDISSSKDLPKYIQAALSINGTQKTATDADFTFTTTGGNGTGALSWLSTNTSVATINANTGLIHIIKAGNTTIKTIKATDDIYNTSNQASYNLVINKANQAALSINGTQKTATDADFTFTTTGGNGTGALSWVSTNTSVATINASTGLIHILKAGNATIKTTKATDNKYNASNQASYNLVINKANQTTLSINGTQKTATDADFTFTTTGGNGTGALSWESTNTGIATINADTGLIHIIKAGNTTIKTTKATDDIYNTSNQASYNLVINKANQATLSIGGDITKKIGHYNGVVNVTGGSTGGTVSYDSSHETIATINLSGKITLVATGVTRIYATMQGDDKFNDVIASFVLTVIDPIKIYASHGDFRGGDSMRPTRTAIANMIKTWNPERVLFCGDNYDVGHYRDLTPFESADKQVGELWHNKMLPYKGIYGDSSIDMNRVLPVIGNHELYGGGNNDLYANYFGVDQVDKFLYNQMPGYGGRVYEYKDENIHWFVLDSNRHDFTTINNPQMNWIKPKIMASDASWKIVSFHHPPYSLRRGDVPARDTNYGWDAMGVDFVINGHDHNYQRITVPGQSNTVFIINGAGGTGLYSFTGSTTATVHAKNDTDYGALKIIVSYCKITTEYYLKNGNLFDSYSKQKCL
ncbi:MAG: hypothetical protein DRQ51_02680 [Gammaproteobacteria bacterium]|nr:MAG: hypothetical protein DRQ51_02680 [Gammaproteobacteria bacterium]